MSSCTLVACSIYQKYQIAVIVNKCRCCFDCFCSLSLLTKNATCFVNVAQSAYGDFYKLYIHAVHAQNTILFIATTIKFNTCSPIQQASPRCFSFLFRFFLCFSLKKSAAAAEKKGSSISGAYFRLFSTVLETNMQLLCG